MHFHFFLLHNCYLFWHSHTFSQYITEYAPDFSFGNKPSIKITSAQNTEHFSISSCVTK